MTERNEDDDLDWKRARELADKFPPWSDEEWREANAALGYRTVSASEREKRTQVHSPDPPIGEAA